MPFPLTGSVLHAVSLVRTEIRSIYLQGVALATAFRNLVLSQKLDAESYVVLYLEEKDVKNLQHRYKRLQYRELLMRYRKGVLRDDIERVRLDTALSLCQKYTSRTKDNENLEDAILEIYDYLSATDILTGTQRDTLLSLQTFGHTIDTIMHAQNTKRIHNLQTILNEDAETLSSKDKIVRANFEDMYTLIVNITQYRYTFIGQRIDNSFRIYFRLNEIMQLLFVAHDIANDLNIQEIYKLQKRQLLYTHSTLEAHIQTRTIHVQQLSSRTALDDLNIQNLQLLSSMYLQQAQLIQAYCPQAQYKHINERIAHIGQHTIPRELLNALQMFLAIAACRELSNIACREFNLYRVKHMTNIIRQVQGYGYFFRSTTLLAYRLFTVRISNLLSIYYNHRALLYLCQTLQLDTNYTHNHAKAQAAQAIMHILQCSNDIILTITLQMLWHIKAHVIVYIFNSYADIEELDVDGAIHAFMGTGTERTRLEIINKVTRWSLNGQLAQAVVAYTLQKMGVQQNAQLKCVINSIFAIDGTVVNSNNYNDFKKHIYMLLDSILCSLCCDVALSRYIKDTMRHIVITQHTRVTEVFAQQLQFTRKGKLCNNLHNVSTIANVIKWYEEHTTFQNILTEVNISITRKDKFTKSLLMLDIANSIAPYKSHIIYFAIENMIYKAHQFMLWKIYNTGKKPILKICGITAVGSIVYGLCCTAQSLF